MRVVMYGLMCVLTGCAGDTALRAQFAGAQLEWAKAQAEIQKQPLLDIQWDGDKIKRLTVRQPTGGGAGYQGPQLPDDPWARVADRAVGVLGTVGGIYAGGWASREIVRGVGEFGAGLVQGLGNPAPSITTTYTGNRYDSDDISNSFNPWSNTGRVGGTDDYTAPPLVVEQPRPVIVTQPAPVVVQ